MGVLKRSLQWLRKKLPRQKKSMLTRTEEAKNQVNQPGTYESVILEPLLKRSQTPRGIADGVAPQAGAKQSAEKPGRSADKQEANGGKSSFESLLAAAHGGDAQEVTKLVVSGASPNEQDGYGWTPLRYAVRGGHTDAAMALIELGADVNLASMSGRTPLMSAAGNGLPDMVKMLLKAGADHKALNKDGETAFRISMRGGKLGCAECRVLLTI